MKGDRQVPVMEKESRGQKKIRDTRRLPARIRARRLELGLRAYELAEKVGVSPSWISLIEKGAKVPSETVAARIAEVLGDDVDQYRIWAGKARLGDKALSWVNSLERWQGLWARAPFLQKPRTRTPPAWLSAKPDHDGISDASPPQRDPSFDELSALDEQALLEDDTVEEEIATLLAKERLKQKASTEVDGVSAGSPPTSGDTRLRWVPLLSSPDIIPARGKIPARAIIGNLPADERMFPESSGHLIALEMTRECGELVDHRLFPGDLVVVDLEDREGVDPTPTDQIYLIRTKKGIIFSRCAISGSFLILQPDSPKRVAEIIEIPSGSTTLPLIVGRVIWSAHRYERPES